MTKQITDRIPLRHGAISPRLFQWTNSGNSVTSTATYDETGQMISRTDPCGNASCSDMVGTNHTTTYSYADQYSSGTPSGNTNSYLTLITPPPTNGVSHATSYWYRLQDGQLSSSRDPNGQTTTYSYNDPLNRITEIQEPPDPNNEGQRATTQYIYNDSAPSVTTSELLSTSGVSKTTVSLRDGMKHVIQTQLTTDPEGTDYVDTSYDGEGRILAQSNPHRFASAITDGKTTNYYDSLGEKLEEVEPDGNKLQWCYNGVPSTPGVANCSALFGSTSASTRVDETDEVGNHWQRISDAFGRLISVIEPNGSSQTPSMETDYGYNALNDLTSVVQSGGAVGSSNARARSFGYDWLSRLSIASNPETGTLSYSYDVNGIYCQRRMLGT